MLKSLVTSGEEVKHSIGRASIDKGHLLVHESHGYRNLRRGGIMRDDTSPTKAFKPTSRASIKLSKDLNLEYLEFGKYMNIKMLCNPGRSFSTKDDIRPAFLKKPTKKHDNDERDFDAYPVELEVDKTKTVSTKHTEFTKGKGKKVDF